MAPRDASSSTFKLPPLPYAENALEPVISGETLSFHHGKHHRTYVDTLNKLVQGTPFAEMNLEDVVRATAGKEEHKKIFNNAAQAWNHTFYWQSLSPKATKPTGALLKTIEKDCESLDALQKKLVTAATDHFASGWAWVVVKDGKIAVVDSHDADTPMAHGVTCLLTVDVWEHAYYLDYQNVRKSYVEGVMEKLLNWDFAAENFAAAGR